MLHYYDNIQCSLMAGGNLPLITPSQSLIYCRRAAISRLRGRELVWKMEGKKISGGEMEIGECTFDASRDSLLLPRHPSVGVCFLCTILSLKRRRKRGHLVEEKAQVSLLHMQETVQRFNRRAIIVAIYLIGSFSHRSATLYVAIN